jgi:hypothetical protein
MFICGAENLPAIMFLSRICLVIFIDKIKVYNTFKAMRGQSVYRTLWKEKGTCFTNTLKVAARSLSVWKNMVVSVSSGVLVVA